MDVIGDTQMAISSYFSLPQFSANNGGYLYLYGVIQAFFMQQDALNNLSKALLDEPIDFQIDYPDLYFIRDLSNSAVGHPTSRGKDDSFHYITRYSLGKGSFELMSHFPKSNKFTTTYINLEDLRRIQEESVSQILDKVIDMMENEYNDHKGIHRYNKKRSGTKVW